MTRTALRRATVLLLGSLLLAACTPGAVTPGAVTPGAVTPGAVTPGATPAGTSPAPRAQPFELYTHCGIDELNFEGRWYERVGGALGDGNPPPGWGNPSQPGTLTPAGGTVVFRDRAGHEETFRLRPGASGPKRICA